MVMMINNKINNKKERKKEDGREAAVKKAQHSSTKNGPGMVTTAQTTTISPHLAIEIYSTAAVHRVVSASIDINLLNASQTRRFRWCPMDKPIKQSKFVPNRSPRQPGSNQTRVGKI